jgi:hypothetical protein
MVDFIRRKKKIKVRDISTVLLVCIVFYALLASHQTSHASGVCPAGHLCETPDSRNLQNYLVDLHLTRMQHDFRGALVGNTSDTSTTWFRVALGQGTIVDYCFQHLDPNYSVTTGLTRTYFDNLLTEFPDIKRDLGANSAYGQITTLKHTGVHDDYDDVVDHMITDVVKDYKWVNTGSGWNPNWQEKPQWDNS